MPPRFERGALPQRCPDRGLLVRLAERAEDKGTASNVMIDRNVRQKSFTIINLEDRGFRIPLPAPRPSRRDCLFLQLIREGRKEPTASFTAVAERHVRVCEMPSRARVTRRS